MNISKNSSLQKISPPQSLNLENAKIWEGWNLLGDKEVVREASAKGFYVNLAINFIAARKNIDVLEAQKWFKEQVLTWVAELLGRKQIFRAAHILSNINVDPFVEFIEIFCQTEDKELREYLGNHVVKNGKLDDQLHQSWILLDVLAGVDAKDHYTELVNKYGSLNVSKINKLDCDYKYKIATEIFIQNYDFRLMPFLKPDILWNFLLIRERIDVLKHWINTQFSSCTSFNDINVETEVFEQLINLFKTFTITHNMINSLSNCDLAISLHTKNIVLNALCKYGIFNDEEQRNLLVLLSRLKQVQSITDFKSIFTLEAASLNLEKFYLLLIDFCIQHEFYNVINLCTQDFNFSDVVEVYKSHYLGLMSDCRNVILGLNNEVELRDNLLKVALFINSKLSDFLNQHPIISLALVVFGAECVFSYAILNNRSVIRINNCDICLEDTLTKLPLLKLTNDKCKNELVESSCNYLDLLEKHGDVNIRGLYKLCNTLPHFIHQDLIEQYGYKKTIDFILYINQCRPSTACRVFLVNCLKNHLCVNDCDRMKAKAKISKLAVTKFLDQKVTSSCIVFLEMIGVDSEILRILVETANAIYASSDYNYSSEAITDFLKNVELNKILILRDLEFAVMKTINEKFCLKECFAEAIRKYEIAVKFAQLHNLSLPQDLPIYFANNDLWLEFLIFVQIYNYPFHQVQHMLQNFKTVNLLEHVNHSVLLSMASNSQNEIVTYKTDEVKTQEMEELQSTKEALTECCDGLEKELPDMKATLLQILIRCHDSYDPPKALLQASQLYRNPLLAVLATTYEPDSVETSWLTWLVVACNLCEKFMEYDSPSCCPKLVLNILEDVVKHKYLLTLQDSFYIFLPDNPLVIFIEFLNLCLNVHSTNDNLIEKLQLFRKRMRRLSGNSIISDVDPECTFLSNKVWIQKACLLLIAHTLQYNISSLCDQIRFLRCLIDAGVFEMLTHDTVRFFNILQILNVLYEHKCDISLDLSVICNDADDYCKFIKGCVENLVDIKKYKVALKVAEIEKLNPDSVVIEELKNCIRDTTDIAHWEKCNETFKMYKIDPQNAVGFFKEFADKVDHMHIRHELLKYAYAWAIENDLSEKNSLLQQMWLSFVYMKDDHKKEFTPDMNDRKCYREMKLQLASIPQKTEEFQEGLIIKVKDSINFLLHHDCFWDALVLEKIFNCKNQNLEILKVCCSIAEGMLLPEELDIEQKILISRASAYRNQSKKHSFMKSKRQSSLSISSGISQVYSVSKGSELTDQAEIECENNLATIESLLEKLRYGVSIGENIFMNYRMSINTGIPYNVLTKTTDDMKLLKEALETNCKNKLDVVHDCMSIYKWPKLKIADFICVELVEAVRAYANSTVATLTMWDLNLDTDFRSVVQLLQDNWSMLGIKLFSYANAVHISQTSSAKEIIPSEIVVSVELLIRSHDCFATDCNMEGISLVLKKTQTIISVLITMKNWQLIVRLLTGIARYTEMNYVFHILKENDQFECLLRKGSKKDNALKTALLEYLRKYCPDDQDLYRIVALHFTLFSEVAQLWEKEAENIIRNLIEISRLEMENDGLELAHGMFVLFTNTDGTRLCLEKAKANYVNAAEYHLEGEKFLKAMNAAKKAELLALQMSKLRTLEFKQTTICLLNLSPGDILFVISSHNLSFAETLIVIEAYNFKVDWAKVLFHKCILGGEIDFFDHFLNHIPLTDGLVHDLARRFSQYNDCDNSQVQNMIYMLNRVPSVHTKYRIASELNLSQSLRNFVGKNKLAYLQDTIWKT